MNESQKYIVNCVSLCWHSYLVYEHYVSEGESFLMKKLAHTFAIQVLCDALYMLGACSQDHHAKLLALSFLLQIHMKDIKYEKGCFL